MKSHVVCGCDNRFGLGSTACSVPMFETRDPQWVGFQAAIESQGESASSTGDHTYHQPKSTQVPFTCRRRCNKDGYYYAVTRLGPCAQGYQSTKWVVASMDSGVFLLTILAGRCGGSQFTGRSRTCLARRLRLLCMISTLKREILIRHLLTRALCYNKFCHLK
jgi:hypothetical protein